MKRYALIVTCLLAGTPAIAQSVDEKTGLNSLIGTSPTTEDFVLQAAISDMFEMQSSRLALERADEKTKSFAQQMIADHEKVSGEMKAMVTEGKVKATIPTALDSSHQSKLDKLKELNGADFTKRYRDDQVTAHKNAVDLFQRYANGGENAELKAWAAKTVPSLEHHLKMAQDLDKQS